MICPNCGTKLQKRKVSCPDKKPGCAVAHYKFDPCPKCSLEETAATKIKNRIEELKYYKTMLFDNVAGANKKQMISDELAFLYDLFNSIKEE